MQKLLFSNYNALIFFKKPSLYMYSWNVFPLKRKTCIHLHLLNDFLMFILFISLKF